jgi:curved DNA-binding protein CbpA
MNFRKDYYKIMAVSPKATQEEIKHAYQRLARQFHPDRNKEINAEQRIKEINEAYEVLKDPQQRSVYDASFRLILPYTYTWFLAKKNAWIHTHAKIQAKKKAGIRANQFLIKPKKNPKISTHARLHTTSKENNMKTTKKFPLILMGAFVLLLSAITIGVIFAVEQISQWQDHQEIQNGIVKGEKTAIEFFEQSEVEKQKDILNGEHVRKALVDFYRQQTERPLFVQLEIYEESIVTDILNDEEVYQSLKEHVYQQIVVELDNDQFEKALSLLTTFKSQYPTSQELIDKEVEIQNRKHQRLAELTQQYMECLDQMLAPLLDRTHCMAEARQKIKSVGIEHNLPGDPNLPAMYTEEIRRALMAQNYESAEQVLSDWQKLLPDASIQREALREELALHRQVKNIIADLSGSDRNKMMKWLNQLRDKPTLQQEVFSHPQVQNNLIQYHLHEALALMTVKEGDINLNSTTKIRLEQILEVARGGKTSPEIIQTVPWYGTTTSLQTRAVQKEQIVKLLQECQEHFKANRLTTGNPSTALICYKKVLTLEPRNREAKKGLRAIEGRYRNWAENALRRNKLRQVKVYLVGLEKVNPTAPALTRLKKRLKKATEIANNPEPKPRPERKQKAPKPKPIIPPVVSKPIINQCDNCNCSDLLKQLSMGVKPLTPTQQNFFQTQCR